MIIQTVGQTDADQILFVFNQSFSDYLLPLNLTKDQFAMKLKSENILMNISVGVFEGSQLIALMLHGYTDQDGIKSIYNAGTGVIPSKRGKKIATQMFQYIIPILKKM